ncbi:MAG: hypothetical protein Q4C42_02870 [Clostridia bacterium]|nr:hypothetical protein [Clostridia bacterium]
MDIVDGFSPHPVLLATNTSPQSQGRLLARRKSSPKRKGFPETGVSGTFASKHLMRLKSLPTNNLKPTDE